MFLKHDFDFWVEGLIFDDHDWNSYYYHPLCQWLMEEHGASDVYLGSGLLIVDGTVHDVPRWAEDLMIVTELEDFPQRASIFLTSDWELAIIDRLEAIGFYEGVEDVA